MRLSPRLPILTVNHTPMVPRRRSAPRTVVSVGRPRRTSVWLILENCDRRPITGANQMSKAYWTRIKSEFDERKFTKDYHKVHMDRNQGAIEHRWRAIQKIVNKFHGCLVNIRERNESGKNYGDQVSSCQFLLATSRSWIDVSFFGHRSSMRWPCIGRSTRTRNSA